MGGGLWSLVGGFFSGGFLCGGILLYCFFLFLVGALHGQACFMAQKKFAACKNDDVPQHVVWDIF